MAAFYLFAECVDGKHEECAEEIPLPEDAPEDLCGGAFCSCPCHFERDQVEEV